MTEAVSLREAYGKTLVELGRENPDIVMLDADLCRSTMTQFFAAEFPERSFDCGIAEQNMIGIAAGLAASGKIPFASTFAVFVPGRCYDQIRMSIAQPKLNVKLVTTHGDLFSRFYRNCPRRCHRDRPGGESRRSQLWAFLYPVAPPPVTPGL